MSSVLHIARREDWERQKDSSYRLPSLEDEGFLHLSDPRQANATMARHFDPGDDLVLLEARIEDLAPVLIYEDTAGRGEAFPHLYGALDPAAVRDVHEPDRGEDGAHRVPAHLAELPGAARGPVQALSFDDDGETLVVLHEDGAVRVLRVGPDESLAPANCAGAPGDLLRRVGLWVRRRSYRIEGLGPAGAAWLPLSEETGDELLWRGTGTRGGALATYLEIESGKEEDDGYLRVLAADGTTRASSAILWPDPDALALAPDGTRAVIGMGDGALKGVALGDGSVRTLLDRGLDDGILALAVLADGQVLAAGRSTLTRLTSAPDGTLEIGSRTGLEDTVTALAVSPDGARIALAAPSGAVRIHPPGTI